MTLPNILEEFAIQVGHLTPGLLHRELAAFSEKKGHVPSVLLVHLNPRFEGQIKEDMDQVAGAMQADISVANEGQIVHL